MAEHPIQGMMDTTLQKIREMVGASTVVGDPIVSAGITIIPITKVSYGFASGGSDFPSKSDKELFGGGGGAGVSVSPVAFIVINDGEVKLLQIDNDRNTTDKVIGMVPDLVSQISSLVSGNKKNKKNAGDSASPIASTATDSADSQDDTDAQ